eukprot:11021496-Lingulodinium_polyedra.AAC.1
MAVTDEHREVAVMEEQLGAVEAKEMYEEEQAPGLLECEEAAQGEVKTVEKSEVYMEVPLDA